MGQLQLLLCSAFFFKLQTDLEQVDSDLDLDLDFALVPDGGLRLEHFFLQII